MKRVALIGMPNTGKSTLFNRLTGSHARVGNWPGVTVDLATARVLVGAHMVELVDLPGLYDLHGFSDDELVVRHFLEAARVDAVVVVLNSSQVDRQLALALQVKALGLPTLVLLNMADEAKRFGIEIDDGPPCERAGPPGGFAFGALRHGRSRSAGAPGPPAGRGRAPARGAGAGRACGGPPARGADRGAGEVLGRRARAALGARLRPHRPRRPAPVAGAAALLPRDARRLPGRLLGGGTAAGRRGGRVRLRAQERARAPRRRPAGDAARAPGGRHLGGARHGGRVRAAHRRVLLLPRGGRGQRLPLARGVPHRRLHGAAGAGRPRLRDAPHGVRLQRARPHGHAGDARPAHAAALHAHHPDVAVLGAAAGVRVPRRGGLRARAGAVGALRALRRELRGGGRDRARLPRPLREPRAVRDRAAALPAADRAPGVAARLDGGVALPEARDDASSSRA